MNRWQRWRLDQFRRWEPRVTAHPWLYASPISIVIVAAPALTNAMSGVAVTKGLVANAIGAAVALVLFRWYMPWIARKQVARLTRRYEA